VILDTAFDCAVSGATSRQISNALPRKVTAATPLLFRDQQIGKWAIRKLAGFSSITTGLPEKFSQMRCSINARVTLSAKSAQAALANFDLEEP
jgi:hypothetical protein